MAFVCTQPCFNSSLPPLSQNWERGLGGEGRILGVTFAGWPFNIILVPFALSDSGKMLLYPP